MKFWECLDFSANFRVYNVFVFFCTVWGQKKFEKNYIYGGLFLRKYFHDAKTIKLRNEIDEFVITISRILAGNYNKILAPLPGTAL